MAQATITIKDENDGEVNVRVDFEPEIDDATTSPAQHSAVQMIELFQQRQAELRAGKK